MSTDSSTAMARTDSRRGDNPTWPTTLREHCGLAKTSMPRNVLRQGTPRDSEPPRSRSTGTSNSGYDDASIKSRASLRHFLIHTLPTPLTPATANVQMFDVAMTEGMARTSVPPGRLPTDALLDRCNCAVMVGSDSDLAGTKRPVKRHHLQSRIGLGPTE